MFRGYHGRNSVSFDSRKKNLKITLDDSSKPSHNREKQQTKETKMRKSITTQLNALAQDHEDFLNFKAVTRKGVVTIKCQIRDGFTTVITLDDWEEEGYLIRVIRKDLSGLNDREMYAGLTEKNDPDWIMYMADTYSRYYTPS